MDFAADEPQAILSKALGLIEKTVGSLQQLDHRDFPTATTEEARKLLLRVLQAMQEPSNYEPMAPSVLYNKVLEVQKLVALLARSSTEHIPWPFVGYCDEIWAEFFRESDPQIFYSVTPEHNYSIRRLSSHLKILLEDILAQAVINKLLPDPELYCLELASVEDENLPLYANIGHEFGHALYDRHKQELLDVLNKHSEKVLVAIYESLYTGEPIQAKRRRFLAFFTLAALAKELFCDLVAANLMGPAFYLSFYEMSWGQKRDIFNISLSPSKSEIQAYPSFHFRLHIIKKHAGVSSFCVDARKDFSALETQELRTVADTLETVPFVHASDSVQVSPDIDSDASALRSVIAQDLEDIKQVLENTVDGWASLMEQWYPKMQSDVATADVAALLSRLENNILPNVIPDNTLLGRPVDFKSILNAAALYRMHLLGAGGQDFEELSRKTSIVERLTAKALEVSFIQKRFLKWKADSNERAH